MRSFLSLLCLFIQCLLGIAGIVLYFRHENDIITLIGLLLSLLITVPAIEQMKNFWEGKFNV